MLTTILNPPCKNFWALITLKYYYDRFNENRTSANRRYFPCGILAEYSTE